MELMRWTALVEEYGKELREGSLESPATDVFGYTEEGEKRWKDLKNRVVEHVSTICLRALIRMWEMLIVIVFIVILYTNFFHKQDLFKNFVRN